jgi:hypothetical protein
MAAAIPAPSEAEDDEQGLARLAQFEDCASAIDRLSQQALTTNGAAAFDELLNLVRSFKSLSVCSAMLVRVQRPGTEAVAWLVCQRNGVHARSKEYLGSLLGRVDLGQVSLYALFEAANRVESRTQPVERP